MSKIVKGNKLVRRMGRRTTLSSQRRRATRRTTSVALHASDGAQLAWIAASRVREAAQNRIVFAFRRYVEASGPGPTDAELHLFARLAIAEQRLRSKLSGRPAGRVWDSGSISSR